MKNINAYLTFNGNCREAMQFYRQCLGGELTLHAIADSPLADKLPVTMRQNILHSILTNGGMTLAGSDMVGEGGLRRGNNVSLMLDCNSEQEVSELYNKLNAGGTANHPPERTYWGGYTGDLTDQFGHQWFLHFSI